MCKNRYKLQKVYKYYLDSGEILCTKSETPLAWIRNSILNWFLNAGANL